MQKAAMIVETAEQVWHEQGESISTSDVLSLTDALPGMMKACMAAYRLVVSGHALSVVVQGPCCSAVGGLSACTACQGLGSPGVGVHDLEGVAPQGWVARGDRVAHRSLGGTFRLGGASKSTTPSPVTAHMMS